MSSTQPPPFGDSANVDRENSAAVRKGVLFGCGGCGLLVAAGFAAIVAIVFFVMALMRSDETAQLTLKAAQASEVMKRELGEPMRIGWIVTGNISTSGSNGTVDVTVPIVGPSGDASVHALGRRESGGPWQFQRMEATIKKTGEKVDLRQHLPQGASEL